MPRDTRTNGDHAVFWAAVPRDSRVHTRPMQGSLGAFVNGNLFLVWAGGRLAVRVGRLDEQRLRAVGASPFSPDGQRLDGFVALPLSWHASPAKARLWAAHALHESAKLPPAAPDSTVTTRPGPTALARPAAGVGQADASGGCRVGASLLKGTAGSRTTAPWTTTNRRSP